jgi:hypothetical protein
MSYIDPVYKDKFIACLSLLGRIPGEPGNYILYVLVFAHALSVFFQHQCGELKVYHRLPSVN